MKPVPGIRPRRERIEDQHRSLAPAKVCVKLPAALQVGRHRRGARAETALPQALVRVMKKVLSLMIGPPNVPPYWLRLKLGERHAASC